MILNNIQCLWAYPETLHTFCTVPFASGRFDRLCVWIQCLTAGPKRLIDSQFSQTFSKFQRDVLGDTTLRAPLSGIFLQTSARIGYATEGAPKHPRKHEMHPPQVKNKFCLDSKDFDFIYAGVSNMVSLLSCCLTSTEARWPIRDGDRVGRGRESERLDRGNRPKKTGETVDRRQNNGSVKAVSPSPLPSDLCTAQLLFQLLCWTESLRQCPLHRC